MQKFLSDRLVLQKIPITAKIPKNNFSLMKGGDSGIENQVNFGVLFMNKLRSALEHRTDKANALFEGELYGVPPCISVNCTEPMYQGKMSSILERPQSRQLPSGDGVIFTALFQRHHHCFESLPILMFLIFMNLSLSFKSTLNRL